ncbi:MAG: dihydrodipicolinate reductase [Bacteroidetes bacterium]|nr:dihydrodipicolinate reductase [Rhodothermia bacterium]MCS7154773.1 dihydrodipicolinate reductase [Bacteroidota bacterium]MCX7907070.1 dihydrodipicolinate reductase [Bacteroidota bacterium]MDW8137566.1 dihydrodipicolinate reductase C-terminal domain-containing protein [Bacteroidota bacterium]MDW8285480.1 dihydrodipicolinate reductase C-terminal domain-containing protein [Bacteroidota bacterium]
MERLILALHGYGHMGHELETLAQRYGWTVAERFDRSHRLEHPEQLEGVDVMLDFSHAEAVLPAARIAIQAGCRMVIGTTGWYEHVPELQALLRERPTGVVYGPNFSLGVQVFFRLVERAAALLGRLGTFDAYVLEAHHRHKRDVPSGTALRLQRILEPHFGARTAAVIRAGEIPGEHEAGFDGLHERLRIRHEARSRSIFAEGALWAASWIRHRTGLYTFEEAVAQLFD